MTNPKLSFKQEDGSSFAHSFSETLGNVVDIERGGSPRPIDAYLTDDPEGLNWIKIGDAPVDGTRITSVKERIKPEGVKKTRQVRKGDLILSNSMSFGRPYLLEVDGCIHDGWLVIRNSKQIFDVEYLLYLLSSKTVRKQYKSLAGAGVVTNLNKELVQQVQVSIPPTSEQRKVADFFTTLDEKIRLAERKLTALQNLKSGLMQKIFSREIRFGQDEDSKYPAWKERNFGDIITLISGQDFPSDKYNDFGKGIPYLTGASCISCGQSIESRWTEYPRCLVQSGDVLIVCKGNGVGKVAVVAQEKAHIARQFMAVRAKQDLVDQQFCFYLIQSMVGKIIKNATGMIVGLSRKDITDNTVYLPEKEEQKKISLLFVNIDKKLNIARKILMQLRLLKQAFMQQMFV